MTIQSASAADRPAIEGLLRASQLPLDGLNDALRDAVVAREDGQVVGCAALEFYRSGVLLRSVAVDAQHRGRGVGEALVEEAFVVARSRGAVAAYLLTTTADGYFSRFGFEPIDRAAVPEDVKRSVEFTTACPASAIVMRARITGHIW